MAVAGYCDADFYVVVYEQVEIADHPGGSQIIFGSRMI